MLYFKTICHLIGLYIQTCLATPQQSHFEEVGKVAIVTKKCTYYLLERCRELHSSIIIQ